MTAFTIRLPDEAHSRLREVAKQRKISMNKIFEEMTTIILTEFDAEARFRMRASKGSAEHGLELLNTLRKRHKELDEVGESTNSKITQQ
ncbi:MAG: toxin-antitoxin system HicB family antitoxin [SAR324 cluster bacterium]|nr:toxin-antitoxin system HicB family antitoxin [SAR324 cluster bacterium]